MRLRAGNDAFQVEELPLYTPCGSGEHRYYLIEKDGLTTDAAGRLLAQAHGLSPRVVGVAGRKDKHGITRQWISIHDPGLRQTLDPTALGEGLRILASEVHDNKLRTGHLAGNRFHLGLDLDRPAEVEERLAVLAREGLPNDFGPQRYGIRGASLKAASALAAGDHAACISWLLDADGNWRWGDPVARGSRQALDDGLRRALRTGCDDPETAIRRGGKPLLQLLVSTAQSAIFDAVLAARRSLGTLAVVQEGEVLQQGRIAERCDQQADGQVAVDRGEAVCTGPLPGQRMCSPGEALLAAERDWSRDVGIAWEVFERGGLLAAPGSRRPLCLRFLEAPRLHRDETGWWLDFALPPGGYATTVLAACGIELPATRQAAKGGPSAVSQKYVTEVKHRAVDARRRGAQ